MELLNPSFGLIIWTLLAFLIVLIILKKFAWTPILSSLKERETGIADAIASAERIKAEMAALKSENEALLAKAREERAQILKEARDIKDKMVADAKDLAKTEADKIISEANASIQQQKLAALSEVKNQVGLLVVDVAEKVLRRELSNKNEQESYIRQLAEGVKLN